MRRARESGLGVVLVLLSVALGIAGAQTRPAPRTVIVGATPRESTVTIENPATVSITRIADHERCTHFLLYFRPVGQADDTQSCTAPAAEVTVTATFRQISLTAGACAAAYAALPIGVDHEVRAVARDVNAQQNHTDSAVSDPAGPFVKRRDAPATPTLVVP